MATQEVRLSQLEGKHEQTAKDIGELRTRVSVAETNITTQRSDFKADHLELESTSKAVWWARGAAWFAGGSCLIVLSYLSYFASVQIELLVIKNIRNEMRQVKQVSQTGNWSEKNKLC